MALRVTMSFRMTAVMTTLKGLPRRCREAAKLRISGLCCMAAIAAM